MYPGTYGHTEKPGFAQLQVKPKPDLSRISRRNTHRHIGHYLGYKGINDNEEVITIHDVNVMPKTDIRNDAENVK